MLISSPEALTREGDGVGGGVERGGDQARHSRVWNHTGKSLEKETGISAQSERASRKRLSWVGFCV